MAEQRTLDVGIPHLRAWRVRKLVKQGNLAKAAGVSRFTVQRAERLRVEAERQSAPGESTRAREHETLPSMRERGEETIQRAEAGARVRRV